jgi:hypothetical protein
MKITPHFFSYESKEDSSLREPAHTNRAQEKAGSLRSE